MARRGPPVAPPGRSDRGDPPPEPTPATSWSRRRGPGPARPSRLRRVIVALAPTRQMPCRTGVGDAHTPLDATDQPVSRRLDPVNTNIRPRTTSPTPNGRRSDGDDAGPVAGRR